MHCIGVCVSSEEKVPSFQLVVKFHDYKILQAADYIFVGLTFTSRQANNN